MTSLAVTATGETPAPKTSKAEPDSRIKNLILLIGDGMGPQQIGLLTSYAHQAPHSIYKGRQTALEQAMAAGVIGLVRTAPLDALVTDSAASATQIATGMPARSEMIGLDEDGNQAESILLRAAARGKATGLVTDTRLTHGTPAAFVAHQPGRYEENKIAEDVLAGQVDVLLGAGLRHWIPQDANTVDSTTAAEVRNLIGAAYPFSSKRKDNRNLLVEARGQNYQLSFTRSNMKSIRSGRVLGLFGNMSMTDAIERVAAKDDRTEPSLPEMAAKALELLSQNPRGFFLMVESGQIDWAGHNNDAGAMLHEMVRFDDTLSTLLKWVDDRDDTLLVITADHETGSFGFSYSGSNLPAARDLTGSAFTKTPYKPNFNYARPEILDRLYAQKKSFYSVFRQFDDLPAEKQTAEKLQELANAASSFHITLQQASEILERVPNPLYVKNHRYLGAVTSPKVADFKDFYVFGDNVRMNLLARAVAADQNIVWGTGTHTSTPVVVIAIGPDPIARRFSTMMHMTELGKLMQETLVCD